MRDRQVGRIGMQAQGVMCATVVIGSARLRRHLFVGLDLRERRSALCANVQGGNRWVDSKIAYRIRKRFDVLPIFGRRIARKNDVVWRRRQTLVKCCYELQLVGLANVENRWVSSPEFVGCFSIEFGARDRHSVLLDILVAWQLAFAFVLLVALRYMLGSKPRAQASLVIGGVFQDLEIVYNWTPFDLQKFDPDING